MRAAVAAARVKTVQRLANDLKLAFYRPPEPTVGSVPVEGMPGATLLNALTRLRYIQKQLLLLSPHRSAGVSPQSPAESTDCAQTAR